MEVSVKKYGIFWIPSALICEKINQIKQSVVQLDAKADYVDHPVHSTIFLFNSILQPEEASVIFQKIVKEKSAFEVVLNEWKIFHDDPITQKHTLTWGVKLHPLFSALQISIAESIISNPIIPIDYPVSWKGDYELSYKKLGFPFVGAHWIPHITIASVKSEEIVNGIQHEFPLKPQKEICREIALFLINGDTHTHIISHHLK